MNFRLSLLALCGLLAAPASAQFSTKVLFWGGAATSSHNVPAFRDTIVSYLQSFNMQVDYRQATTHSWVHPDTLAQYDVVLLYSTNQNASQLSVTQMNALTDWINSGRVLVALHGTTNTYINNNATVTAAWRALLGAQFLDHGPASGSGNSGKVRFTVPDHPALVGADTLPASASSSGGQPYWDEGRQHHMWASDTIVIARSSYTSPAADIPWIWVREQGKGFVYYNAHGHDNQVWRRPEFKNQIRRALLWGYQVKASSTALRGQAAVDRLVHGPYGKLVLPVKGTHSIEILDMQGRRVYFRGSARLPEHDVTALPAGTYGVRALSETREAFRGLYVKER